MVRRVVPPLADEVADEITCPAVTDCDSTVPATGARTVASSSRCLARSRFVRAATSEASELE